MATLKPTSMLLGTTRPAELRAWYIKALAPESTGEGAIDLGGFLLVIDGRDASALSEAADTDTQ